MEIKRCKKACIKINPYLTISEFESFFDGRFKHDNDDQMLYKYIESRRQCGKFRFGLNECEEFLDSIHCNNISKITDQMQDILTDKMGKITDDIIAIYNSSIDRNHGGVYIK